MIGALYVSKYSTTQMLMEPRLQGLQDGQNK